MSQQNVEIVRSTFTAFGRGDVNEMLAPLADDAIIHRIDPEGAIYHGKDGFLEATADWTEDFEEWTVSPVEFVDAGDQVLVRVHQTARGKGSGVPVEGDNWFLYALHEGMVTRVTFYAREADALEAAGLSE